MEAAKHMLRSCLDVALKLLQPFYDLLSTIDEVFQYLVYYWRSVLSFLPALDGFRDAVLARVMTPEGGFLAFVFCCFCLSLLKQHCYGPVNDGRHRRPPGPWFILPVVGETGELIKKGPLEFFLSRMRLYGPVFRTHLLGEAMYVVGDFAIVRQLLREYTAQMHAPGLAFSQLVTDMDHVKSQKRHVPWRRYVTAALRPAAIELLYPKLQPVAARHVAEWGAAARMPLSQACAELAMDFAMDGVTGITFQSERTRSWAQGLFTTLNKGLFGVPINWPGTDFHAALGARRLLRDGMRRDLVEDVKRIKHAYEASEDASKLEPQTLLEAQIYSLLPAKALSYDKVFDRTVGNVVAAADATKTMMFVSLVLIASVPRVYEKLREEQRQMIKRDGGSSAAAPEWRAVAALPYLDATLREAMRLLPASNGSFRLALRPLPVGRFVIPAGATIWCSSHILHAIDPALMESSSGGDASTSGGAEAGGPASPEAVEAAVGKSGVPAYMDAFTASPAALEAAFRPERWLSAADDEGGNGGGDDAAAAPGRPRQFITFGGGVHLCPGMGLAYMEAKLLLVHLLRGFHWRLADPLFLSKVGRFPGLVPQPGSDWVELEARPL